MVKMLTKKLREDRGWTLRQMEEYTGISRSQLDKIENNQSMPTIDTLCIISEALGVQITETYIYFK